uniref:Uncharacterized protein n=1 Tax=Anguilla anguilla TaxID=7936 RepID=A0A0E9QUP7_ANGAN
MNTVFCCLLVCDK